MSEPYSHSGETTSHLKDFGTSWERVFILLEDGTVFAANSPKRMWSTVLQEWTTYCPADARSELSMCLGEEVHISLADKTIELRLPNGKLFAAYSTREDL